MSIYGSYFTKTLLKQMGWPRRRGFLSSEAVVDATVFDGAVNQIIDWAATLGANRPELALRMIAWMFKDKDWASSERPQIATFISEMRGKWNAMPNTAPHDIVAPVVFSKHFGKTISTKQMKDKTVMTALEQFVLDGLLWGLANPDKYRQWSEQYERDFTSKLPMMQKAGVDIKQTSPNQWLEESEAMLKGYEKDIDPLPVIPPTLLEDAKAAGVHIE